MPWDVIRSTGLRRVAIGIVNQGLPCALPEWYGHRPLPSPWLGARGVEQRTVAPRTARRITPSGLRTG